MVVPQPWQHRLWVRHSQVRGGPLGLFGAGGGWASAAGLYTEQFTGSASDENSDTLGRSSSTACDSQTGRRRAKRRGLTFMPRFVRNLPHERQSSSQTLWAMAGWGGGAG